MGLRLTQRIDQVSRVAELTITCDPNRSDVLGRVNYLDRVVPVTRRHGWKAHVHHSLHQFTVICGETDFERLGIAALSLYAAFGEHDGVAALPRVRNARSWARLTRLIRKKRTC